MPIRLTVTGATQAAKSSLASLEDTLKVIQRTGTEVNASLRASSVQTSAALKGVTTDLRASADAAYATAQAKVRSEKLVVDALRGEISAIGEAQTAYARGTDEYKILARQRIEAERAVQAALGETAAATARATGGGRFGGARGEERGFASRATGIGGFIAGPGFIAGALGGIELKSSLDAVKQEQVSLGQLQLAIRNTGNSWPAYRKQVQETIDQGEKFGFTGNQQRAALTGLVRVTGDVGKAQKDLSLAWNIARGTGQNLETVTAAITQAENGRFRGLQRLVGQFPVSKRYEDELTNAHIKVTNSNRAMVTQLREEAKQKDKNITITNALELANRKFAGSAERYNNTAAGATAQLRVAWERLQISVGRAVLPAITTLAREMGGLINFFQRNRTASSALKDALAAVGAVIGVTLAAKAIPALINAFEKLRLAMVANPWVAAAALAAVAAVEIIRHWETVKKFMEAFWVTLRDGFNIMWDEIKIMALEAYKAILEPFSHLPGAMGGWARKAKDSVDGELGKLRDDMQRNGDQVGAAWGTAFENSVVVKVRDAAGRVHDIMAVAGSAAAQVGGAPIGGVTGAGTGTAAGRLAQRIVRTATTQIGVPYHIGGPAQLGKHTDCSGLAIAVLRANGINVSGRTTWDLFGQGKPVAWGHLQPGDLIFFNIQEDGGKPPQHVGVYIGSGQMIHDPHTGASVEYANVTSAYWRQRFFGARRYIPTISGGGAGAAGDPGGAAAPGSTAGGDISSQISTAADIGRRTAPKKKKTTLPYGPGSSGKRTYSFAQLMGLWIHAGGPAHLAAIAAAIATAESGGRSDAIHHNTNGTTDYGCWQINSSHGYDAEQLLEVDQEYNARAAVSIWHSQGFHAWSTYTSGAYEQYLRENAGVQPVAPGGGPRHRGPALTSQPTLISARAGITTAITAANAAIATAVTGGGVEPGVLPFYQYAVPDALQKTIDDAESHLHKLRERLSKPMTATALANLRVNIRQWETVLSTAISEAGRGASAAAQIAAQHEQNAMRDVQTTLQRAFDRQTQSYVTNYQRATSAYVKQFNDTTQRTLDRMQVMVHSASGSFLFGGDITQTPAEARLAMLQQQDTQNQLSDQMQQAQDALTQAQLVGDPQQIADAQKQVDAARRAQLEHDLDEQAKVERDAADKQLSDAKQAYQDRRDAQLESYQQMRDDSLSAYEQARQDQWQGFQDLLADQNIYYQTGVESWSQYVTNLAAALAALGVAIPDAVVQDLIGRGAGPGKVAISTGRDAVQSRAAQLGFPVPGRHDIPLQRGGFMRGPTRVLIGEHEPEAVIPWSWLPEHLSEPIAAMMRQRGSPGSQFIPQMRMRRGALGFIDTGPMILRGQPITTSTSVYPTSTTTAPQDPVRTAAVVAQQVATAIASQAAPAAAAAAAQAASAAGPPQANFNVHVTVLGSAVKERDLALSVRDQLVRWARANGVKIFSGYA